jgi:hypothetical protein
LQSMKLTVICSLEKSKSEISERTLINSENAADSEPEDHRVEEPAQ